jgi:hypothetical protein
VTANIYTADYFIEPPTTHIDLQRFNGHIEEKVKLQPQRHEGTKPALA